MKKLMTTLLSFTLLLTLAACGGGGNGGQTKEAPDLNQYYEDFMAALGDEGPMVMDLDADMLAGFYPGLEAYGCKQLVGKMAAISATAFEFVLVELEDASHAQEVADILQARVDAQASGGAMYPMTVEAWGQAKVITHGGVVALICAGEVQADAEAAFNALFE